MRFIKLGMAGRKGSPHHCIAADDICEYWHETLPGGSKEYTWYRDRTGEHHKVNMTVSEFEELLNQENVKRGRPPKKDSKSD